MALQLAGVDPDDVDSRRNTIAHAVLRLLLARWIGFEAALRTFTFGYAGKPQLAHNPSTGPVDFSLSHTGAVALIGLARHRRIGVDIERPRRVSMNTDRRRQIISVAEAIGGSSISDVHHGDAALLAAWVRLEAASKATGEGMGRLLNSLSNRRFESRLRRGFAINGRTRGIACSRHATASSLFRRDGNDCRGNPRCRSAVRSFAHGYLSPAQVI